VKIIRNLMLAALIAALPAAAAAQTWPDKAVKVIVPFAAAGPTDVIWFEEEHRPRMEAYLRSGEATPYHQALEQTGALIDGFQSPLGMELLATVDWLLSEGGVEATVPAVKAGLSEWPGGKPAGQRKLALFDDRMIELALQRLACPAIG